MNVEELRSELEALAGPVPSATDAARDAVGRRVRRARRRTGAISAMAGVVVAALVAGGVVATTRSQPGVKVRTTSPPTTVTPSAPECVSGVTTVPSTDVPADVAALADHRPVVGGGELWTARDLIELPAGLTPTGVWDMKVVWFTRPLGIPRIDGRRLDGPGTFHADANVATSSTGRAVTSSLVFSAPGCWEVTARYDNSTITFRTLVGDPPRPLAIGRIAGTLRMVGGPAPGIDRSVGGFVALAERGGIVWNGVTTGSGSFTVDVPVGTYEITGSTPSFDAGRQSACGGATVIVARGRTTRADVICSID